MERRGKGPRRVRLPHKAPKPCNESHVLPTITAECKHPEIALRSYTEIRPRGSGDRLAPPKPQPLQPRRGVSAAGGGCLCAGTAVARRPRVIPGPVPPGRGVHAAETEGEGQVAPPAPGALGHCPVNPGGPSALAQPQPTPPRRANSESRLF